MKKIIINIAKDFSRFPYGRSTEYSNASGEKFREKILLPAFHQSEEIIIVLDGVEGYGSSFLDEAFAGLIRISNLNKNDVLRKLHFVSKENPSLKDEIISYIKSA